MATAEQSGELRRDYSSPATWGDVESVRLTLETQIATKTADLGTQIATNRSEMDTRFARVEAQIATNKSDLERQMAQIETRLTRWIVGAVAGGVAIIGVLIGVLEAVR